MKNSQKIRVMVLYGGRSGEHEVSLRSAASVVRNLDSQKYEVIPVGIDPQGEWVLSTQVDKDQVLLIDRNSPRVTLSLQPTLSGVGVIRLVSNGQGPGSTEEFSSQEFDVVFPVMHGPLCEDGAIQGLFELADIAYVGCGILASAVGMDKEIAKKLLQDTIPVVPYLALRPDAWKRNRAELGQRIVDELQYPVFVKPANMGSSVGVHKVKDPSQLEAAVQDAFRFDSKILVERGLQVREIELSVLQDLDPAQPPRVSIPGEIVPKHEFYSYEAKYLDDEGAKLLIPAQLDSSQVKIAQKMAQQAFQLLGCEGMARVDLFIDQESGQKNEGFYFNEINTIPGFTSISMYPKLWEHSGISYPALLTQLIELAIQRHQAKKKLVRKLS